jgi:hypothetical protein
MQCKSGIAWRELYCEVKALRKCRDIPLVRKLPPAAEESEASMVDTCLAVATQFRFQP